MSRRSIPRAAALIGLVFFMAGCEGVKQQLGMTKQSPDEFRVVSRAPLTLPPNFALRPPEPGIARPQEGSPTEQARRTVFRVDDGRPSFETAIPNDGRSRGERAFLHAAGSDQSDPNIRLIVERETQQINDESVGFIDRLVFWREEEPHGDIVDPDAETRRIREASALGDPVTGDGTPTIVRRKKALLEGIF